MSSKLYRPVGTCQQLHWCSILFRCWIFLERSWSNLSTPFMDFLCAIASAGTFMVVEWRLSSPSQRRLVVIQCMHLIAGGVCSEVAWFGVSTSELQYMTTVCHHSKKHTCTSQLPHHWRLCFQYAHEKTLATEAKIHVKHPQPYLVSLDVGEVRCVGDCDLHSSHAFHFHIWQSVKLCRQVMPRVVVLSYEQASFSFGIHRCGRNWLQCPKRELCYRINKHWVHFRPERSFQMPEPCSVRRCQRRLHIIFRSIFRQAEKISKFPPYYSITPCARL